MFTKLVKVRTAPYTTSLSLAAFLRADIAQREGYPDIILTKNGLAEKTISTLKRCMESHANGDLSNWARYLGLVVWHTSPYPKNPRGSPHFACSMGKKHTHPLNRIIAILSH